MTRRALALLCGAMVAAPAANAAAQWGPPPQPAPYPYASPPFIPPPLPMLPNPFGGMQAGGLTPPPPMASAPASGGGQTVNDLDRAKQQDSKRGLEWAWINAEGGFSHLGLRTFNVSNPDFTAGFASPTASGGSVGVGLGARLLFFTLGARGRLGLYSGYQTFSLGPEAGLHIPLGKLDPHVDVGGGYLTFASIVDPRTAAASPIALRGYYVRVGGGLDYYLARLFSVGLDASFELLGLTRPALSTDEVTRAQASPTLSSAERADAARLATTEASFGAAVAVTGVLGLHF